MIEVSVSGGWCGPFSLVLGDDGSGAVSGSEAVAFLNGGGELFSAVGSEVVPTFGVPDLDATKGTCDDDAAVETTQFSQMGQQPNTALCVGGHFVGLARKVPECVHVDATSGDLRFESFGHPVELFGREDGQTVIEGCDEGPIGEFGPKRRGKDETTLVIDRVLEIAHETCHFIPLSCFWRLPAVNEEVGSEHLTGTHDPP